MVGQGVTIDIVGAATIEGDEVAHMSTLTKASVGHRWTVEGRNNYRISSATFAAVEDNELHDVVADFVQGQCRVDGSGFAEHGSAAAGLREEAPLIGELIAIDIARSTAIQGDKVARLPALVLPALATGALLRVEMATVSGALLRLPSETISCAV